MHIFNFPFKEDIIRNMHENIADNRGILAAYYAYLDVVKHQDNKDQCLPGIKQTPQQLFWVSAANTFCSKDDKKTEDNSKDEHSADNVRINEAFSNSREFARDFKCKPGTKMNPIEKCIVRK